MSARILIIEDDFPSSALVRYMLEAAGHTIIAAGDGAQGVNIALTQPVDLVICDLQLPKMDGYAVLARLLSEREWRRVPVIAVTASSMTGAREGVLAAGFDGYISKPIEPDTFVAQVNEFLLADRPGSSTA